MRGFCWEEEVLSQLALIPAKPGVYTLVIELGQATRLRVGSLGELALPRGVYAYTGSALGKATNLRNRVGRHFSMYKKLRWHVDYLLASEVSQIRAVVFAITNQRMECSVSKLVLERLGVKPIFRGFGSSDCREGCITHLCFCGEADWLRIASWIAHLYVELGLYPRIISAAIPEEKMVVNQDA